jgi:ABC-type nitrate/sulfonate/bicarbonate transport system permease component
MADRSAGPAKTILLPAVTLAALGGLWEASVTAGLAPATVAAPSRIARTIYADWDMLWFHVEPTLLTATIGFLAALVTALCVGFLVHSARRTEPTVLTVAAVLDSVPIIAIAPILIIWLGLSLATRIAITGIICLFPMLISVIQGLGTQPPNTRELFAVLAATQWQRFRLLALPNALPYLFVGLKIAAPLAVLGALVAEWTGAEWGLGVFMINAMFGLRIDQLWSAVLLACLMSSGAYGLVSLFEYLAIEPGRSSGGGEN